MDSPDRLNKYTSLPVVIDMLWEKHLVLTSPSKWTDRNDAYFLRKYKREKKLETVLAACFCMSSERYHHWKVFADGSAGICVQFDREKLISKVQKNKHLIHKKVDYHSIKEFKARSVTTDDLPFIKRWAFQDESEYRIIYCHSDEKLRTYSIPITFDIIRKITLSPTMPASVSDSVIAMINSCPGADGIIIKLSTLLENEEWKEIADNADEHD
jgi:hypothetical protein